MNIKRTVRIGGIVGVPLLAVASVVSCNGTKKKPETDKGLQGDKSLSSEMQDMTTIDLKEEAKHVKFPQPVATGKLFIPNLALSQGKQMLKDILKSKYMDKIIKIYQIKYPGMANMFYVVRGTLKGNPVVWTEIYKMQFSPTMKHVMIRFLNGKELIKYVGKTKTKTTDWIETQHLIDAMNNNAGIFYDPTKSSTKPTGTQPTTKPKKKKKKEHVRKSVNLQNIDLKEEAKDITLPSTGPLRLLAPDLTSDEGKRLISEILYKWTTTGSGKNRVKTKGAKNPIFDTVTAVYVLQNIEKGKTFTKFWVIRGTKNGQPVVWTYLYTNASGKYRTTKRLNGKIVQRYETDTNGKRKKDKDGKDIQRQEYTDWYEIMLEIYGNEAIFGLDPE